MDSNEVKKTEDKAAEVDNKSAQSPLLPEEDSPRDSELTTRKQGLSTKFLPWLIVAVVIVAGAATTLYYRNRANEAESNPTAVQQEKNQVETDRVLTALKEVLFIGEQDAPTVARVEDPEKLKSSNQEFYKDIQKGDYLVIYPKRAIIFRESIGQIMNIAPIINTADLQQKQAESSEQPAAETKTNSNTRN